MKLQSLQNNTKEPHLKVIKNTTKYKKRAIDKIYINTLIPNFSYLNNFGKTISLSKQALL